MKKKKHISKEPSDTEEKMTKWLLMSDVPIYSFSQHISFTGGETAALFFRSEWYLIIGCIRELSAIVVQTVMERMAVTTKTAKSWDEARLKENVFPPVPKYCRCTFAMK